MLLPILLACTSAPDSTTGREVVTGAKGQLVKWAVGTELIAGMDLDQDGIAEWAGAHNSYGYGPSRLQIHQGLQERFDEEEDQVDDFALLDVADLDGDGFDDLLWRACDRGGCRLRIATTLDRDDDAVLALMGESVDFAARPSSVDVLPGSPSQILGAWSIDGWAVTLDAPPLAPSTAEEPHRIEVADVALSHCSDDCDDDYTRLHEVALIPEPDGPPTHFLTGRSHRHEHALSPWLCPVQNPLDPVADCVTLDADPWVGVLNRTIDLDGDGISELISAEATGRDGSGSVWVFERDGTWRATVRGTSTEQFGRHVEVAIDDHGDAWLLVQEYQGRLLAFRGEHLEGDLTDEDADRQYAPGAWGETVFGMTTYRETPDGPLWLLAGVFGGVARLPFEP